ncbi:hypothetical protein NRA66_10495 [Acinetobacter baumannii]|uniref:hypothetical protein n=1 Tax=Acinetobacter baumannii TaxID=470 RepID=UPI0013BD6766|nr:hypothetical protein [Acinetobacter baumannii]MCT9382819.1 hypothetical protein [Acinetobacter baumannii]MDC5549890.1 hypothetical protein [Acinetobacter baumannii]MDV7565322.1 hypothetical protein [Acinetobacter baumannii]NDX19648.1 hypothetical protein [Acinetobacter baumannii]NDX38427.1 hypothetical protein [Acinetobacter baumannii]
MARKNLELKIKDLFFWTFVFFLFYTIIGFLLKTAWLSCTLKFSEVYDLIKDGLTITASFLAPVAALLLFNDWRETHVRVNNEKLSSEIIDIFYEMNSLSNKAYNQYAKDKALREGDKEKIALLNKELISRISKLNVVDSESRDFKNLTYTMRSYFNDWWKYINVATEYYFEVHFNVQDRESNDFNISKMNEHGIKAQNNAILFSKNFHSIKPLLV